MAAPPQVRIPGPVPHPRKSDRVDQEIMAILQRAGRYGAPIWGTLGEVANSQNPLSRAERRAFRLEAWHRLKNLLRLGMIYRVGRKNVSLWKLPRLSVRRRRRCVPGSTLQVDPKPDDRNPSKQFTVNLLSERERSGVPTKIMPKTESAGYQCSPPQSRDRDRPSTQEARAAAQSLTALSRTPKTKLSGFVGDKRIRRGQPVLVNERPGFAYGARRGKVLIFFDAQYSFKPGHSAVVPASDVTIVKNAAAVTLASLKFDRKEKPSTSKQKAARTNGKCPCGVGKVRGRPPNCKIVARPNSY
jgi:hypothetical protein